MYSPLNSVFFAATLWLTAQTVLAAPTFDHFTRQINDTESHYFYAQGIYLGNRPSTQTTPYQPFTLNSQNPMVTLDYGYEVAGYPYFEVSDLQVAVQIEVKYSEEFSGLENVNSDGPFLFSVGLSNSYRVETFFINSTGDFTAFLLQGGERWQSIKLLTNGSITFTKVGFEASITQFENLPGQFMSDDSLLNDIWMLGARAVSATCVDEGTQRDIWEVSSEGSLIRGMRPAISSKGSDFKDYSINFLSKIERGGIGWATAMTLSTLSGGIHFNLIGDLSDAKTFVNINTTLTPPRSILLSYGWGLLNQTTMNTYRLDTFQIPFSIRENEWHNITTTLVGGEYVAVSINDTRIFNVSLTEYYPTSMSDSTITQGSFGFGPFQDQIAWVKDVTVRDSSNGTLLYRNDMTDAIEVLPEFGVHGNHASVCLDGAKRDRLVWLGDFYHTSQIIATSTGRLDYIKGTLQEFIDWQFQTGEYFIAAPIGYPSSHDQRIWGTPGVAVLVDYQALGLIAFASYIKMSADVEFAKSSWSSIQANIAFLLSSIQSNGLSSFVGAGFLGPVVDGTAISCLIVRALNELAEVAIFVNDTMGAANWTASATALSNNINEKLWNSAGFYSTALSDPGNFSIAALSLAITSGVASPDRATKAISHLVDLKLGPGYKDSTAVASHDASVNISPNTNGLLLDALFQANQTTLANELVRSLWSFMVTNNETSTGASWEYVNQEGKPGLGLFTSLSHPWGGAPTYLLTKFIAGIRQKPGSFGWKKWAIEPALNAGLARLDARVPTPHGSLGVSWVIEGNCATLVIESPEGTSGELVISSGHFDVPYLGSNLQIIGGTKQMVRVLVGQE